MEFQEIIPIGFEYHPKTAELSLGNVEILLLQQVAHIYHCHIQCKCRTQSIGKFKKLLSSAVKLTT